MLVAILPVVEERSGGGGFTAMGLLQVWCFTAIFNNPLMHCMHIFETQTRKVREQ
jgi:hypothetical protein